MLKYLSLFSGIGAPESALERLEIDYELVGFSEIDKYAVKSYCEIHDVSSELNLGDITKIDISKIPKDLDLITHGSPCQDYSIAGKQAGGDKGTGTRSSLMWNTVEIVKHCKPKVVIWENVKNVLSPKHRHNYDKYLNDMFELGYINYSKVLNAKNFGIPQNRERIFVVSIRKDIDKGFKFPQPIELKLRLRDMLENEVNEKYYISDEVTSKFVKKSRGNVIGDLIMNKWQDHMKRIYDIDNYSPTINTMQGGNLEPKILLPCIVASRGRNQLKPSDRTPAVHVEQRLEPNTKGLCNTLTSVQKDNYVLENNFRIRKLTPLECWRLMGFSDEDFYKAAKVCSNSQLYKQAGNSIVVNVLIEIFKNINIF